MDAIGNRKRKSNILKVLGIALVAITAIGLTAMLSTTMPSLAGDAPKAEAAVTGINNANFGLLRNEDISGEFELLDNITLNNSYVQNTFKGTLDGKGKTITITGNLITSEYANVRECVVGCLFGTINSGTIKNVKIVFNGDYKINAKNDLKEKAESSTTLYAGIVCGKARGQAKFENIELEINGKFAAMGYDRANSSKGKGKDDIADWSAGQGAIAGGMIGRCESAILNNVVLNNNGSIYAHAENGDAGKSYKGNVINCSNPSRGDRASAGGLIGESAAAKTKITSLVMKGNGVVGSYTTGFQKGNVQNSHCINFAGLLLGSAFDQDGVIECSGLWFRTEGKAYVAQSNKGSSTKWAGVLVGRANASHTILSLWRNVDEGKNAAKGIINCTTVPNVSEVNVSETVGNTGDIESVGVGEGIITYQNGKESKHQYNTRNNISYGATMLSDIGTAEIVGLKDNKLDIEVSLREDEAYYISALAYSTKTNNVSGNLGNYDNLYKSELAKTHTFVAHVPVTCLDFRVFVATTSTSMYFNFSPSSNRNFDNSGTTFTGTPVQGLKILETLRWVSECTTNPENTTYGEYGSQDIITNVNVGTYSMKLYKKGANGEDTTLKEGEIIGTSEIDAPKVIYTYAPAVYECSINRTKVKFETGYNVLSKEYDRTSNIGTLVYGSHYKLTLENGKPLHVEPEFTFDGANSFYTDTATAPFNKSSSVGENKYVRVVGFKVTGNYTLGTDQFGAEITKDFTIPGKITKRTIGMEWSNLTLTYNGDAQTPVATATNVLEGDTVSLRVVTYADENMTPLAGGAKGQGEYYARATVDGTINENYLLVNNVSIIGTHFVIQPKPISLKWTGLSQIDKVFSNTVKTIGCQANDLCMGDTVNVTLEYYLNNEKVSLFNAAKEYEARATIDNDNYVIEEGSQTLGGIEITPRPISVEYYTGNATAQFKVMPLPYIGINGEGVDANYIPLGYIRYNKTTKKYEIIDEGLHVKLTTTGYGLTDANLHLEFVEREVKNVGSYTARLTLVSNEQSPVVLSNYTFANENQKEQTVNIVPKEVGVVYGASSFEYDGKEKIFTLAVNSLDIVYGDLAPGLNVRITTQGGESVVAQNVGTYYVAVTIVGDDNYVLNSSANNISFAITPYSIGNGAIYGEKITVDKIADQGYNGEELTPTVNIYFDKVKLNRGDYDIYYENNVNVSGDTEATITMTGKGNFSGFVYTNFRIVPGTLSVKYNFDAQGNPNSSEFAYNGLNRVINAKLEGYGKNESEPAFSLVYFDNKGNECNDVPIDVGAYSVKAKLENSVKNYVLSQSNIVYSFSIVPKSIQIRFADYIGLIYNGNERTINAMWADPNEVCARDKGGWSPLAIQLSYTSMLNGATVNPKNAGTYRATATLDGASKDNYKIVSGDYITFSIQKRSLNVVYSDTVTTYNAMAQYVTCGVSEETPVAGGDDPQIEVNYTLNNFNVYSPTNAGVYAVSAGCNNPNYMISVTASNATTFTIEKAQITILTSIKSGDEYSYSGAPHVVESACEGAQIGDKIDLVIAYKKVVGSEVIAIESCKDVGSYMVSVSLSDSTDDAVANANYEVANINDVTDISFRVTPRYLGVVLDTKGQLTYNGQEVVPSARVNDNNGTLKVSGYEAISGLVKVNGDTYGEFEKVTFNVKLYNDMLEEVASARDVGTYVYTASLDESVTNYVLYEDSYNSLTASFQIEPKGISFVPKNIVKTYGDKDESCDFTQILDDDITGIDGETISLTLQRDRQQDDPENVGIYAFIGFKLDSGNKNYTVSISGEQTSGTFEIVKRQITFEFDKPFEMDYMGEAPELTKTITVITSIFGSVDITITFERENSVTEVGTYNLKRTFEQSDDNYEITMSEGANLGKFIIKGRSVLIRLNQDKLKKTYGKSDPNLYDAIEYIEIEKCVKSFEEAYNKYKNEHDGSHQGFKWEDYIRIKRDGVETAVNDEHYREGGYNVEIWFIKESGSIDRNYRVVYDEGITNYVFNIEKVVLEYEEIEPILITKKTYDGNNIVNIATKDDGQNESYLNYSKSIGLSAYARYDSADVGVQNITVNFEIMQTYADDYVLPKDVVLTAIGKIEHKKVTFTAAPLDATEQTIKLTYGQTPEIKIDYTGFVNSEDEKIVGSMIVGRYDDGVALEVIRDASNYSIQLFYAKKVVGSEVYEYVHGEAIAIGNYIIDYDDTSIPVQISQKSITVEKTDKVFQKPVDGSVKAWIGREHYGIVGLIESDKGLVDIVIGKQELNVSSVGKDGVYVSVTVDGLSGSKAQNYKLENFSFRVDAEILKLAELTLSDLVVNYDSTPKVVSPDIKSLWDEDRVTYVVFYKGLTVSYGGDNGTNEAPTDVGEYQVICIVKLKLDDKTEYSEVMAKASLIINKIDIEIILDGERTQTYGSFTAFTATAQAYGLSEGLTVKYSFVGEDKKMPKFPPVGEHVVSAKFAGTRNYNSAFVSDKLVIKPKEITVDIAGYSGLVYNGYDRTSDIIATFNGIVVGDTCKPIMKYSSEPVKDAGSYTLTVLPGNKNYKVIGRISVTFVIAKKTLIVTANETTAELGQTPRFNITYEGFVGNDNENSLEVKPSVKLGANKVGENSVRYNKGIDCNYEFVYVDSSYTITYAPTTEEVRKGSATPYLVALGVVGGIGLIVGLAFIGRTMAMRSVFTSAATKKAIRKEVFGKKRR